MLGRRSLTCVAVAIAACAPRAPASADWNGDAKGDVLAVAGDGGLVMYRGNGAGRFIAPYPRIGTGWGSFTALLATDFSGDGRQDLLARADDGRLLLVPRRRQGRLRQRRGRAGRQRLGRLHRADRAR